MAPYHPYHPYRPKLDGLNLSRPRYLIHGLGLARLILSFFSLYPPSFSFSFSFFCSFHFISIFYFFFSNPPRRRASPPHFNNSTITTLLGFDDDSLRRSEGKCDEYRPILRGLIQLQHMPLPLLFSIPLSHSRERYVARFPSACLPSGERLGEVLTSYSSHVRHQCDWGRARDVGAGGATRGRDARPDLSGLRLCLTMHRLI
ncbi:hypothetical protein F4811DRAFT_507900, partial [Daldinia bambusicola]